MEAKTEYPHITEECDMCEEQITGIKHEGFLWPVWMAKENSTLFPPHGPRLLNYSNHMCWLCGIRRGEKWHR